MNIDVQNQGNGIYLVTLSGRFDAFETPKLNEWIEQNINENNNNVIVSLAGVEFIDSSGLASLVKGLKRCRQHGGDLVLCDFQQAVLIIFELTKLDKAFQIFDDQSAALETFAA